MSSSRFSHLGASLDARDPWAGKQLDQRDMCTRKAQPLGVTKAEKCIAARHKTTHGCVFWSARPNASSGVTSHRFYPLCRHAAKKRVYHAGRPCSHLSRPSSQCGEEDTRYKIACPPPTCVQSCIYNSFARFRGPVYLFSISRYGIVFQKRDASDAASLHAACRNRSGTSQSGVTRCLSVKSVRCLPVGGHRECGEDRRRRRRGRASCAVVLA